MISVLPAYYANENFGLDALDEQFQKKRLYEAPCMIAYVPRPLFKPIWNSAFFDGPTDKMRNHLKPLFIEVKADVGFIFRKYL